GYEVIRGAQVCAEGHMCVEDLVEVSVEQKNGDVVGVQGQRGWRVKIGEIACGERTRGGECLEDGGWPVEVPIDEPREVLGDLLDAPLELGAFEIGHAVERYGGQGEERNRQGRCEQRQ